jgi:hypothetical protein
VSVARPHDGQHVAQRAVRIAQGHRDARLARSHVKLQHEGDAGGVDERRRLGIHDDRQPVHERDPHAVARLRSQVRVDLSDQADDGVPLVDLDTDAVRCGNPQVVHCRSSLRSRSARLRADRV